MIVTVAVYEQSKSSKLAYHVPVTMCVANFPSYHFVLYNTRAIFAGMAHIQHIQTEEARKSACLLTDLLIILPTGILFHAFLCRVCIVS